MGGTLLVVLSMLSNLSMPVADLLPTTLWILSLIHISVGRFPG